MQYAVGLSILITLEECASPMPRNTFSICEIATANVRILDFLTVQGSLPFFLPFLICFSFDFLFSSFPSDCFPPSEKG